ncbi:MAG: sulfur carrier protein ThiS [Desulfomicrobium sp.]|jgi:sulfur carrier protein|nr:sulfur carrier protein ThiS [Desulfomicrobium sp.]
MYAMINGTRTELPDGLDVLGLVRFAALSPDTVVVEVNGCIIERAGYDQTMLKNGDQVEIVSFVGGG